MGCSESVYTKNIDKIVNLKLQAKHAKDTTRSEVSVEPIQRQKSRLSAQSTPREKKSRKDNKKKVALHLDIDKDSGNIIVTNRSINTTLTSPKDVQSLLGANLKKMMLDNKFSSVRSSTLTESSMRTKEDSKHMRNQSLPLE